MAATEKRRRPPNPLQTFWVYRWLFLAAIILGTLLWFILTNSQQVTVYLPFGLGHPTASIGLIVLFSAGVGALIAVLVTAIVMAFQRYRDSGGATVKDDPEILRDLPDDRPPSDYAAKTPEGFSDAPWSAR